jgi:anaerobic magnesium-protoporphyrin IX monomethyl ester cyclase
MKFALVDLEVNGTKANRDHTGGFGSHMHADGLSGKIVSRLKERLIQLPMTHFGYAAAILREAGHEVNYHSGDAAGEDVILIASSMHCYTEEVAYARRMKAKFPKSQVGFFGAFVKTHPEKFEAAADFLIFGELEATLFQFVDGKAQFEGRLDHGLVTDMARLPTPDWRGLDISQYGYFPLLHRRPFITIQSSRGCSFDCDFCPYMVSQTKKYRQRPAKNVVDEMETLIARHGIRSVLFRDLIFTINRKHVEEICRLMIERNVKLEWACETRVDCLPDDLIDLMVKAGFRGVNLGIETVNPETLAESGKKPANVEQQERTIAYMQSRGVRINGFYMLGLIGDTPKTMQTTIDYAEKLNTLGAQFCTMTPFPGTRLYERVKDSLLTDDFSQYDEYQPVVDIKTSTPQEVREYAGRAFQYYLRPSWLVKYGPKTFVRLMQNGL